MLMNQDKYFVHVQSYTSVRDKEVVLKFGNLRYF